MAYPPKQYTAFEYNQLSDDVYRNVSPGKLYYMPIITGNPDIKWTIRFSNVLDPEGYKNPIYSIKEVVSTQDRVLLLVDNPTTVTPQQVYKVKDSGFDNQQNPWANATGQDGTLNNLPIGTVVAWTVFTQSYSAITNGPYAAQQEIIGTYLDFGQQPVVLPQVGIGLNVAGDQIEVYEKYTIIVFDETSQIKIQTTLKPSDYNLSGFAVYNILV